MRKALLFFTLIFSFSTFNLVNAELLSSSGFIPGQIWYSKDSLEVGETVNIYTALWNNSNKDLSFKVEFYDKNVILGTRNVVVGPMVLKDVYVPWKITAGDHVISAKIISSTTTISGKQQTISIEKTTTSTDKKFISASKEDENTKIDQTVSETVSKVGEILPEKVSSSVSTGYNSVEDIRLGTLEKVDGIKNDTKQEIEQIKKEEQKNSIKTTAEKGKSIEDATHKPITYIKLFMFSLFSFILSYKIIFYGLLALIIFYIIRAIYRKVR